MAHIGNRSLYILNADAAPTFAPPIGGGVAHVTGTSILYFFDSGTTWTRIDMGVLSAADGNETPITAGNAITGVAPTSAQVPNPSPGDTASKFLTNRKLEKWVYTNSWNLAWTMNAEDVTDLSFNQGTGVVSNNNGTGFTIAAATTAVQGLLAALDKQKLDYITVTQAVNLDDLEQDVADLTTLTGVAGNNTNLGTFSGSTIPDNATLKAALQALETALETATDFIESVTDTNSVDLTMTGSSLKADLKVATVQNDTPFNLSVDASGTKVTKKTLTAYDSFAAGDAAVNVGEWYKLSENNTEGIPSPNRNPYKIQRLA